jgi:hypothetical protein
MQFTFLKILNDKKNVLKVGKFFFLSTRRWVNWGKSNKQKKGGVLIKKGV